MASKPLSTSAAQPLPSKSALPSSQQALPSSRAAARSSHSSPSWKLPRRMCSQPSAVMSAATASSPCALRFSTSRTFATSERVARLFERCSPRRAAPPRSCGCASGARARARVSRERSRVVGGRGVWARASYRLHGARRRPTQQLGGAPPLLLPPLFHRRVELAGDLALEAMPARLTWRLRHDAAGTASRPPLYASYAGRHRSRHPHELGCLRSVRPREF